MTFDDWVSEENPGHEVPAESAARARRFEEAARARAQAERERTRSLRRHRWRARAELLRRTRGSLDDTSGS